MLLLNTKYQKITTVVHAFRQLPRKDLKGKAFRQLPSKDLKRKTFRQLSRKDLKRMCSTKEAEVARIHILVFNKPHILSTMSNSSDLPSLCRLRNTKIVILFDQQLGTRNVSDNIQSLQNSFVQDEWQREQKRSVSTTVWTAEDEQTKD